MRLNLVKVDVNAGRSGIWGNRPFRKGVHAVEMSQEDIDKLVPLFERFYGARPERAARLEHPEMFEEGGPYFGDHPVLGPRDLRREGQQPAEGPAAAGPGDAAPAPGPEREPADPGGGHERPEADGRGTQGDGLDRPRNDDPAERVLQISDEIGEDGSIEVTGPGFTDPAEEPFVEIPAVAQESLPIVTDIDLAEAVGRLDPEVEVHWTPQGFPNLEALQTVVGRRVTRREVDAVAKGYNRRMARDTKE